MANLRCLRVCLAVPVVTCTAVIVTSSKIHLALASARVTCVRSLNYLWFKLNGYKHCSQVIRTNLSRSQPRLVGHIGSVFDPSNINYKTQVISRKL